MDEIIRESSMTSLWDLWFTELHQKRVGLTIKIKRLIYSGESPYQRIDILDTYEYGRMLVLYGSIMVTEKDEFVYHEMISHVPLYAHPNPRKVLIIGGGDGGTLREVLRHPEVDKVTMVEIDKMVVEKSIEFLPTIATDFDNPRAKIIFEDGEKYLDRCKEKYDIIIVDGSDPVGPAEVLFQKKFHEMAYGCLASDGIFVTQSESPLYHQKTIRSLYRNLKDIFPVVNMYLAHIPTYPSAFWSFAFCSRKYNPLKDFNPDRVKKQRLKMKYYNSDIHNAAFSLPNFVRELVEE